MTHKKELVLCIIGIIMIISGSYIMANLVHKENKQVIKKEEDEPLKVGDQLIQFKTYRVDKTFFIQIPDIFSKLDEATLKSNYPTNDRPELVFQTADTITHVFVSTTNEAMTDEGLSAYVANIVANSPTFTVEKNESYQKHNKFFARLSGLDTTTNTYRDIRYFTIDNKLAIIEFNTSLEQKKSWKKVSEMILDSICFDESEIEKK